ncbi:MAG TPA: HAMP domain-containing sensor histidine kinase [Pirellulales bacterium]|nr:HAMP domain-containing sensor histidine kinase [Pirellulales bacterium]
MRWPIRYQILLPFAAAMLLGLLSASVLSAYLAARRAERQINEQLRHLGRTLTESSFPLTDAVLEQMRGLSGAEFALVDSSGKVVAKTPGARVPRPASATDRWQDLQLGRPTQVAGKGYFVSSLTMASRGPSARPVVLHILYPEEDWRTSRQEAALPPLVVGTVTLAAFMAVAAAIAARLGRPIARLRTQVANLATGNFQTLSLPERNDELRDLAEGVNSLSEQLAQMRRAIGRAERLALLGQLSGGLAHHLRNDLTGARMAVQLHLRHGCHADGESLAIALRQLKLTEDHLQHFLSAGQPRPLEPAACDPAAIVEEALRMIEPTCRHRRVEVSFVDLRARPTDGDLMDADAEQVRQLLLNLAYNALEAAGPGGSMRFELDETIGLVRLRVIDSGPGMADEIAERLFEPFATTKPEGIGLGLAAARQIARSHGGTLDYRREGDTTCFELTLPQRTRAAIADPTPLAEVAHAG